MLYCESGPAHTPTFTVVVFVDGLKVVVDRDHQRKPQSQKPLKTRWYVLVWMMLRLMLMQKCTLQVKGTLYLYLKSLTLKGFKSFADKTQMYF